MPGVKTNERPGTRAVLRHYRMSASKIRQVLDLVRGQDVDRANEILRTCEREAAEVVSKVLASAVANAVHNEGQDPEELYVSACFADEGATLKRWRPRARGRATRIRKRTAHVTIIVSRLPEDRLARRRSERLGAGAQRSRRVSESRRRADLAGRLTRRRVAQEAAAEAAEVAEAEAAEAAAVEAQAEPEELEEAPTGSAEAGETENDGELGDTADPVGAIEDEQPTEAAEDEQPTEAAEDQEKGE